MEDKDQVREDTRRAFDYQDTTYYLNTPNADTIRRADWHYSKVYNDAIAAGILTQSEVEEILRVRGMIGEDYENEKSKVEGDLDEAVMKLEIARAAGEEDGIVQRLALDVGNLRNRLYELNQRRNRPMSNTCEGLAEDARIEYIVSEALENENGTPVFVADKSTNTTAHDKFVSHSDRNFTTKSKYEFLLWMQGLTSDFFEQTPETRALKELQVKKAAELIEAMKQIPEVQRELQAAKEAEEKEEQAQEEAVAEESVEEEKPAEKPKAKRARSKKSAQSPEE